MNEEILNEEDELKKLNDMIGVSEEPTMQSMERQSMEEVVEPTMSTEELPIQEAEMMAAEPVVQEATIEELPVEEVEEPIEAVQPKEEVVPFEEIDPEAMVEAATSEELIQGVKTNVEKEVEEVPELKAIPEKELKVVDHVIAEATASLDGGPKPKPLKDMESLFNKYKELMSKPNKDEEAAREKLNKARKTRTYLNLLSGIMQASETMSAGAGGVKAKADVGNLVRSMGGDALKDAESDVKSAQKSRLRKLEEIKGQMDLVKLRANLEAVGYDLKNKRQMNDPNSPISQYLKGSAKKQGVELDPGMTAAQIEPHLKYLVGNKGGKWQLTSLVDPNTQETIVARVNVNSGETVPLGKKGFAYKYMKDPHTGEITLGRDQIANKKGDGSGDGESKSPSAFKSMKDFNPKDQDRIESARKNLDKDAGFKDGREAVHAAGNAKRLLKFGGDNADIKRAIQNMLARSTGERGVMTEEDVKPFGGKSDLVSRLKSYTSYNTTGKIPESDREFLAKFATVLEKAARKKIDQSASLYETRLAEDIDINRSQSAHLLQYKIFSGDNSSQQQKTPQQTNKPETALLARKFKGKVALFDPETKQFIRWK